jgi:preprotein translocase subunit YajC
MGGGFGMGMGMGRGLMGTVTEVAADHYTIKTDAGEVYIVHYRVNTRILKQSVQHRGADGQSGGQGGGQGGQGGERGGGGGNPPQQIKPTDIKVGDAIATMGETDAAAKSVGAVMVMQLDPERAKQMREMQANYGKTWLMGKITAMDGVKVTLMGALDNAPHDFVADENTAFRKRRDPITLADLQVGDTVRVEGGVKDGAFLATTVNAMGAPQGGNTTVPRDTPPQ